MKEIPDRLYKYRTFNDRTLDMLIVDRLFFADPSTFNDPLDTKPSLETDLPDAELEGTLFQLVEERIKSEMTAAAKTIKYKGPKTLEHIRNLSRAGAKQLIDEVQYHAENPAIEEENPHQFLLGEHIEEELLRRYDTGIFSLAERADCPLMWSHYGDQHRGICAGFAVPSGANENLHRMAYGGSRVVKASDVAAMLKGDKELRKKVDAAVLLRKAADWNYEREWRLIDKRGIRESTLELKEVIFGMRCPSPVKFAVMKALAERNGEVKLLQISVMPGTFLLDKHEVDKGELGAQLPRNNRGLIEQFQAFLD